jgi:hypothetical protein
MFIGANGAVAIGHPSPNIRSVVVVARVRTGTRRGERKMLIGNDWRIEADSLGIQLYHRRLVVRKDTGLKEEDWGNAPVGYYSSVRNAIHDMVERSVRETKLVDIRTVDAKIAELHRMIEKLPEAGYGRVRVPAGKGEQTE